MRMTINIAEDALIAARNVAQRERIALGDAISVLVRRGAVAQASCAAGTASPLRGRFALLAARDEIVTPQHVRTLMGLNGM